MQADTTNSDSLSARHRPDLDDLYRLARQLEQDRSISVQELKRRDHQLAVNCQADSDRSCLLKWLDQIAPGNLYARRKSLAANVACLLAFGAGLLTMSGFLLANQRGLVNVFFLLLVFVLVQLVLSVFSALVVFRSLAGHLPASLPPHPATWLARRSLPDHRDLREAQTVLRLLLLGYGQAWGFLFTLAALLAFVAIPAVNDFSFVWGSTFGLSDEVVAATTRLLALPWSSWLPVATVDNDVISNSRFHPALLTLDRAEIEHMRGWWSFLFMCLLCYALLPRLLLWLTARYCYRTEIRRAFINYPGAELLLMRLRAPLVRTQAGNRKMPQADASPTSEAPPPTVAKDSNLLLLNWSDALGESKPWMFEELLLVADTNVVQVGSGSIASDRQRLTQLPVQHFQSLALVVKSWEPPMAELSDLLEELQSIPRCTIYLRPLHGKPVPHRKIEDWRAFARQLAFAQVDVRILNPVANS